MTVIFLFIIARMNFKSKNIAIICSDLEYFNASICTLLFKYFKKQGFDIRIYLTYESESKEKEYVQQLINTSDTSGLVIFSCMSNPLFYVEFFKECCIPCVFVDRFLPYVDRCSFVTVDNYGGAYKLGKLLQEKGSKNIACLSMLKDNKISTIEDRINGFRDSHVGINNINCFRVELEYTDIMSSIYQVLEEWSSNNIFPDAVFATNHLIMNGILKVLQNNKEWRVKFKDILLSCFDNLPYYDWLNKPIISIEQPINDIAFYTAGILHKTILSPKSVNLNNIILPVKVIDRTII